MKPDIAQCRQLLGDAAKGMTDDDITRIVDAFDAFSEIGIELYLQEKLHYPQRNE